MVNVKFTPLREGLATVKHIDLLFSLKTNTYHVNLNIISDCFITYQFSSFSVLVIRLMVFKHVFTGRLYVRIYSNGRAM